MVGVVGGMGGRRGGKGEEEREEGVEMGAGRERCGGKGRRKGGGVGRRYRKRLGLKRVAGDVGDDGLCVVLAALTNT